MSIIHVMPSMTSPLPMRRAISIMFAIACGARSDFMNSRIASWPSVVAPSFIISAHRAAGSLDVSDTCFSAAIAAPASKSTTAKPATARIVTYFIAVPPLEPCPGEDTILSDRWLRCGSDEGVRREEANGERTVRSAAGLCSEPTNRRAKRLLLRGRGLEPADGDQ